jgi:hypothetical protein
VTYLACGFIGFVVGLLVAEKLSDVAARDRAIAEAELEERRKARRGGMATW